MSLFACVGVMAEPRYKQLLNLTSNPEIKPERMKSCWSWKKVALGKLHLGQPGTSVRGVSVM
jgi:hypothetical protein